MSAYKIIIKPLKSIEILPKMEGKSWEEDGIKYLCLEQHIFHISCLPLSYCIAVYDKNKTEVQQDFKNAGRDMMKDWLIVMECRVIEIKN